MLSATRAGRRTVVLTVVGAMALVVATTAVAAVTNFTDVPDDHLFAAEIAWMDENDITRGVTMPEPDSARRTSSPVARCRRSCIGSPTT